MKRKSHPSSFAICSCCADEQVANTTHALNDDPSTPHQREDSSGRRVAPARSIGAGGSSSHAQATGHDDDGSGSGFLRLAQDNPWLVCRSPDHGGKLFWMHERTQETTWRQPLPRLGPLPAWSTVHQSMRDRSNAVLDATFFGAPADQHNPKARTGICGVSPSQGCLQRTTETLSPEHCLYPKRFLDAVGLRRYVMCEELRYNGQRRRDVPDLASGTRSSTTPPLHHSPLTTLPPCTHFTGTLYIDVGDRATRRKRHSFHHELWHMVDFHLLGNAFEAHDAEWAQHNPPGFSYGLGGKHMRSDSSSSQLSSAPNEEFLNRYSTSSIAEDKAEIWACLMCYQQVLKSPALQAKARLLQKRARSICSEMNDQWWAMVVEAQRKQVDHWEVHYVDAQRGKAFWCNWVTEEKRWTKPVEAAALA